jgi:hypothetical protein
VTIIEVVHDPLVAFKAAPTLSPNVRTGISQMLNQMFFTTEQIADLEKFDVQYTAKILTQTAPYRGVVYFAFRRETAAEQPGVGWFQSNANHGIFGSIYTVSAVHSDPNNGHPIKLEGHPWAQSKKYKPSELSEFQANSHAFEKIREQLLDAYKVMLSKQSGQSSGGKDSDHSKQADIRECADLLTIEVTTAHTIPAPRPKSPCHSASPKDTTIDGIQVGFSESSFISFIHDFLARNMFCDFYPSGARELPGSNFDLPASEEKSLMGGGRGD